MTLRDALAEALVPAFLDAPEPTTWEDIYPFIAVTNVFTGRVADAILSDPAFRAALTEAVAVSLAGGTDSMAITESIYDPGTSALDTADEWYMSPRELAERIVAGMLP